MIELEKLKDQGVKGTLQNWKASSAPWRPSSSGLCPGQRGKGQLTEAGLRARLPVLLGRGLAEATVGILFGIIGPEQPTAQGREEPMVTSAKDGWTWPGRRRDHPQSLPSGGVSRRGQSGKGLAHGDTGSCWAWKLGSVCFDIERTVWSVIHDQQHQHCLVKMQTPRPHPRPAESQLHFTSSQAV